MRDDMDLSWRKPVKQHSSLSREQIKDITNNISSVEVQAEKILRLAASLGKVVFVTLARSPWVFETCRNYFPLVHRAVTELKIPTIYAQDGVQVDYDKQKMMSNDDIAEFYSAMKGKAIGNQIQQFYTQYEGQSWKNVISIGDSDFERLGTFQATENYMRKLGLLHQGACSTDDPPSPTSPTTLTKLQEAVDQNGHYFKVRTKVMKTIDQPTCQEMALELKMTMRWLPKMVKLDDGFDFNLETLNSQEQIQLIEDTLKAVPGESPPKSPPKSPSKSPRPPKSSSKQEPTSPPKSPSKQRWGMARF